jgi:hypothetical protein
LIGNISGDLRAVDAAGKRLDLGVSDLEIVQRLLAKTETLALPSEWREPGDKSPGASLRINADLLPDGFNGTLHAIVSGRVTKTGAIPITADVDAVRDAAPAGGTLQVPDYVAHLEKALDEVVGALDEQARLLGAGNATLVAALAHEERDVRVAAARTLGERRARDAVEPLCAALDREQGQVGQAFIGALAVIGDERAVPCLIQWAGSEDRRVVLIVEPLAAIGGREAREYLDMIASGHDDPRLRRAAEEGVRRLSTRAKAPAR